MRKFLLSTIALLMAVATMAGNGSSKANAIDFDWANGNTHEAGTLWYRVNLSPISGMVDPTLALYLTNLTDETAKVDVTVSATVTFLGQSRTETQDLNYLLNAGDYKIFSKNVKQLLELGVTDIYLELASDKEIFLSAKKYEQSEIVDEACTKAISFDWAGVEVTADSIWYLMDLTEIKDQGDKKLNFVVTNLGAENAKVYFDLSLDCPASNVLSYEWDIPAGGEMTEEFGKIFINNLDGNHVYLKLKTNQELNLKVDSVKVEVIPENMRENWSEDVTLEVGKQYTFAGTKDFVVNLSALAAGRGQGTEFVVTNNAAGKAKLTKYISLTNPVEEAPITKVLEVEAGASVTKKISKLDAVTADKVYVRFEADQEVTIEVKHIVVNEEVMNAKPIVISTCETSEKLDWNSVITQKGAVTKWYEIDLASIKQNDEHLQLSFTNKTENIVVVMGEILATCGAKDTIPYVVPLLPGQTVSQAINYNMFALLPHPKHFYVSATVIPTTATSITDFKDVRSKDDIMAFVPTDLEMMQAAEVELVASTVSALVDPTACNDAATILRGVKYEQAGGTTKWYRVTDDLLNSLSLIPDLAFINNGKKAANVTIAATVDCEHATFGMSTISVPTWADLTVYPSRLIGNLLDKALNGDVKEMYLQVTTDQPIAFGIDINYGFGFGCDDARKFNWETGATIKAGDFQWLEFDITSAKKNEQQVRLTLTNESNSLAWVAMLVSLTCPFEVAVPVVFPIPAGMSVDKVIDYSYFASTRLDQLYVALVTEENISVKAVAEKAQASAGDMAACANAVEVKNGEAYVHNPGTTWYKFDGSLFSDISRLPKFRYAAEGTTSVTFGATVGCEYNIATRGTIKLPTTKGLEVSFRMPGAIFEALKRVDNGEVDVVYLELTTDKQIKWGMDMEYAGGCEKATVLDFNQPIDIDLQAGKDIWYQVDLKQLKAMGDKRINFNLNNASNEAVEVEIEVTPTCPLLVSAIKTVSVPANTNVPGFFPASTVTNLYDEVIAKFNVPEKISNNLPSQLQDDMVYFVRVRANGDLHIDNEGGDAPETVEPGCDKATLLDITSEIDVNDLETGWYVVDMTTITSDFTLKFINTSGANQTLDMDFYSGCDTVAENMKDNWLTSYKDLVVPTTGLEQFVPYSMIASYITMDELYIYLVKEEGGEVDMACASAILIDPTQPFEIKIEAGKEQWFKIAPQVFENFNKNLRVKAVADKNITVECAVATSCPALAIVPRSFDIVDDLSVDTLLTAGMIDMAWEKYGNKVEGIDTAYIRVLANGNMTLQVTPEDVVIPEVPEGCENATELDFSKTIKLSELKTGWYHVDLTPIKNGSVKKVSINNDLGKETGVKFDIFRNCDPSSFLYTYTHAFSIGLFEQSIPSAALSMLGSVDELYIYLTMDVDILTCEDAIEFDWTKGAVHAADDTQWYHFDINPVKDNAQQVKLTFTNHSDNLSIVYGEVALHCPHKYSIPYALVVPAGMSIDKVVDYSVFAASRVEELYVKVHSTETIELGASSESALVFDNTPCENAAVVTSGVEYKQSAGTSWYKFSKELFMNTGKLPKFYFTTEAEGLTTITLGATVGCEYNIATKTIAVLPGSLNYAMVVPEQLFDVLDKMVNDEVTEVYVEMTTDKPVHFSVDMINNTDDACHSAELISIENGIKLEANVDKWYKIDFDVLKAMKSDLAVTVINPSGQPVDVDMELSPTCPVVISLNKSITIPGFSEATKIISQSLIAKIPGIPFYVRFTASADVEIQFSEYERVEDPTVCQDAISYIWGTDLKLTGNEDAWYKLAIADLRGKNCDITLSVTNTTTDTVSAAFELYDTCPVDLPIVSMDKVEAAPNKTTTKTVSSSYLPDDVDTLYLHIRPTDELIVNLSSTCLPDPVLEYAYDTIADNICANTEYVSPITSEKHMIATAVETWNDTVHVSAILDSVYTFVITPIVAPEVMTDPILASIYGTLPVLTPGKVPAVDVNAIINYYAAIDTETIADVVSVEWDNTTVDCDATTHAMTLTVVDACGNVLTSVHTFPVAARKPGNVTNAYICSGDNYVWLGKPYNATGTYNVTLQDVNGCDSVETLNLTVLPGVQVSHDVDTICFGESYTWAVTGEIIHGQKAGTITRQVKENNFLGCDSIEANLSLVVLPEAKEEKLYASICLGESYTWAANGQTYTPAAAGEYTYIYITYQANGCVDTEYTLTLSAYEDASVNLNPVTLCYGEKYTWTLDGVTEVYDKSGTYTRQLSGCNATVTLILTILNEIPVTKFDTVVCYGEEVNWNGKTYNTTGQYTEVLSSQHTGCDSVVTMNLTVLPKVADVYVYDTICNGQTYTWQGKQYTTATTDQITLFDANGCEYTEYLVLTVTQVPDVVEYDTICEGTGFMWENTMYFPTTSTKYTAEVTEPNGCKYSKTVYLTVLPITETIIRETLCEGDSILWQGQYITTAGDYTVALPSIHGCDSIVNLNVSFIPNGVDSVIYETICDNMTYQWNGETLTQSGEYTKVLSGCNASVTLNLTVLSKPADKVTDVTLCSGETYTWLVNGVTYNASATETVTKQDANGCEYKEILNLTILPAPADKVTDVTLCAGETYTWIVNGVTYNASATETVTKQDANGCEYKEILNLTILPATVYEPVEQMTLCYGESTVWNGITCNASKTYTYAVKNVLGCDSVVYTLNLTVLPAIKTVIEEVAICYGETYSWHGKVYAATGMYPDTLVGANNCDSIVTLHLIVMDEILPTVVNDTICYGDTYTWNGNVLNTIGQYQDTLQSTITGCDSIVTLNLTVLAEIPVQTETASIPYGTTYTWAVNNQTYAATGIYSDTLTTAHGCDSVWILDLTVENPVLVYAYDTINAFVCDGNVYEDPITKEQHIISSLVPSTLKWNDTVHVSAVLDSVYTINVTPVVAPMVMTDAIIATIPGATPVLTAGLMPDVTGTVAAIEAYYASIDTEAISDVVSVAWDAANVNTAVPCGATEFVMTLVVEDECDNVLTTVLTFPVAPSASGSVENITICHGETYTWLANGVTYNASTTETVTLSNVNGCDSVVTLNLTVLPAIPVTYENAMICYGEDYPWYGGVYSATGQYSVTLQSAQGCDSVLTLNLVVLPEVVTLPAQDTTICYGESFTWHGMTCDASKTYTYKEKNVLGCDSLIHTLNVHVLPAAYEVTKDTLVCAGETFVWNGQTCDATKAYTHTVKNVLGCDSIVYTLNVEFLPAAYDVTKDTLVCAGETFIWYGQTCDATKAYTHTVKNVLGCDSINYTLNVEMLPAAYDVTKDTVVCYGESFTWYGQTCDATKAYTHTVKNVLGCDSINYTLNVEVLPAAYDVTKDTVVCYGESFTWYGQTCDATKTYTHTVKNVLGCDSINYTLNVEVLADAVTEYEEILVCESDFPYEWRGEVLTAPGTYTVVEQYAATGCDSVIHVLSIQTYVFSIPAVVTDPIAVCGNPVDVTAATADIEAHIASESNYAPNATITWYIQNNGTWVALTDQLLKGTDESVTLKYVITSDCGELSDTFDAIPVEMPTPANDVDMDNIPVVSKYDNRVLLLHLNAILATHGWTPEPADVKWYRVVNELDTYGEPGDDEFTGITGHYFNYADASVMTGQYYALIVHTTEGNADECDAYLRTEVITCTVNKVAPRLLSNVARPDDNLTLINLNPEMITEIRVYSTTGELMATYTADQVEEYIFKAAHVSGYYMVDVETQNDKVTLRYVVK